MTSPAHPHTAASERYTMIVFRILIMREHFIVAADLEKEALLNPHDGHVRQNARRRRAGARSRHCPASCSAPPPPRVESLPLRWLSSVPRPILPRSSASHPRKWQGIRVDRARERRREAELWLAVKQRARRGSHPDCRRPGLLNSLIAGFASCWAATISRVRSVLPPSITRISNAAPSAQLLP